MAVRSDLKVHLYDDQRGTMMTVKAREDGDTPAVRIQMTGDAVVYCSLADLVELRHHLAVLIDHIEQPPRPGPDPWEKQPEPHRRAIADSPQA